MSRCLIHTSHSVIIGWCCLWTSVFVAYHYCSCLVLLHVASVLLLCVLHADYSVWHIAYHIRHISKVTLSVWACLSHWMWGVHNINPFNASCSKLLLFKRFSAILVWPTILFFDIRVLWCSVLSARAPKCQKLKIVGLTSMAKCKALTGSAVKGLSVSNMLTFYRVC